MSPKLTTFNRDLDKNTVLGFTFICWQRSRLPRAPAGLQPSVILVGELLKALSSQGRPARREQERPCEKGWSPKQAAGCYLTPALWKRKLIWVNQFPSAPSSPAHGRKGLVPGMLLPPLPQETDGSSLFSLCKADDILKVKRFPVLWCVKCCLCFGFAEAEAKSH